MTISREPWVGKLIDQYSTAIHELQDYHGKVDNVEERSAVNRLISNLSYSLTWMKTGREPGTKRGADRRSVYQRTVILDTELFPSLQIEPEEHELSNEDKQAIVDSLMKLSNRERQVYILHEAYGLSLKQIGIELSITKRSAQEYLERSRKKILSCRTDVVPLPTSSEK